MPARGKGQYQKSAQSRLRGRWHDFNSQRRRRNKTTVTWENYKKITRNGAGNYPRTSR